MSTNPGFEHLLEKVDPARRDMVRKLIAATAVYTAPVILSYSMESIEGTARAQSQNQTVASPIPTTSGWTLTALAGVLAAAGAILLRRRGEK
jgi:hypothetical protein